jgi:hypothetical protein
MTRFRNSNLSLEKFAENLAEQNKQFVTDVGRYWRGDTGDKAAWWLAMLADVERRERGPWGSTVAATIERHVRRIQKKHARRVQKKA